MQQVIFLLVAALIGAVIFKVRRDAAAERKTVMARLDAERAERGDYSPTAELFREVGVQHESGRPVYERLSDLLPEVAPEPAFDAAPEVGADAAPEVATEVAPEAAPEPPVTEPPVSDTPSDLRTLFKGISMPAGLRPLGPLVPVTASFVTEASPAEVHAGLDAEFERLECVAHWVEPTVAQTERNGMRGIVTIYPNPTALTDLDGAPLFPDVAPGHVVVKMLAL